MSNRSPRPGVRGFSCGALLATIAVFFALYGTIVNIAEACAARWRPARSPWRRAADAVRPSRRGARSPCTAGPPPRTTTPPCALTCGPQRSRRPPCPRRCLARYGAQRRRHRGQHAPRRRAAIVVQGSTRATARETCPSSHVSRRAPDPSPRLADRASARACPADIFCASRVQRRIGRGPPAVRLRRAQRQRVRVGHHLGDQEP